ncbi:MAG: radical SAM protein [Nanoarchaeota archaeon]|nr:radical SAM protein [Nanoarchaeota archaeon]
MKVTFIQPSMGKIKGEKYVKSWQMQPLSMAVLGGMTPKDVEINFYDDRFDEIPYNDDSDLVAITTETYTAQRGYKIADGFRERGIPVVIGGIQTSLVPNEARAHADSVAIGDSEFIWPEIIKDLRNGKLQPTYTAQPRKGILPHVSPRRELFDKGKYVSLEMVETGRGCPFTCDFCSIAGSYDGSFRTKNVKDIVKDIEGLEGRTLYFVDDNFVSNLRRTKDLCKALVPLGKKWFSHGSINMANDAELLKLMEKSGCANILIGFESLNPKNLEDMGKSWGVAVRGYTEAINKLRDHGVTIYGTFVFGYDHDTPDDFKRTLDFAIEQKFALAAFNHLVPFPGTPLYSRLQKQDRLLDNEWWLNPQYRFGEVAFKPANMSAETLAEKCFECREDFYSYSSTFKRMFDFKANCRDPMQAIIYLAANLVSKKGIAQRQWWPVGSEIERKELDSGRGAFGYANPIYRGKKEETILLGD